MDADTRDSSIVINVDLSLKIQALSANRKISSMTVCQAENKQHDCVSNRKITSMAICEMILLRGQVTELGQRMASTVNASESERVDPDTCA